MSHMATIQTTTQQVVDLINSGKYQCFVVSPLSNKRCRILKARVYLDRIDGELQPSRPQVKIRTMGRVWWIPETKSKLNLILKPID